MRAIIKGHTQCYECDPPPPPLTFPFCTIRNHPDKPIHCIIWAKEQLFPKLFGGEDTDLIDTAEAASTPLEYVGGTAANGALKGTPVNESCDAAAPLVRQPDESLSIFSRRVFHTVFEEDTRRLLAMEDLWKTRAPPTAVLLDELALPDALHVTQLGTVESDSAVWSVEESAAVFLRSCELLLERLEDGGPIKWDKDDLAALDFVTSASNIRSTIFSIPRQMRWDVKAKAGSIIPAIATTNAIIAGYIVLEALKILSDRESECRYCVCNRSLGGKKGDLLLQGTKLDPPKPSCIVCSSSKPQLTLTLDTTKWTLNELIAKVVKMHLSFNRPTIDVSNIAADRNDQLCEGNEDSLDEAEKARYEALLRVTLASLPVPVVNGCKLDVQDTSQDLEVVMMVRHAELEYEKAPEGFLVEGGIPGATTHTHNESASDAGASVTSVSAKRAYSDDEANGIDSVAKLRKGRPRPKVAVDDNGVVCLDHE